MKLFTKAQREQMLKNGRQSLNDYGYDPCPVVKLFAPDGAATWLLASIDPEETDIAFGLCDLGLGSPELGTVRISELEAIRGRFGLRIERDRHWQPTDRPISAYARVATARQRLVDRL